MRVHFEGPIAVVEHAGQGNQGGAAVVCEQLRRHVERYPGKAVVYHKADALTGADDLFVAEFMAFEKWAGSRVKYTVCYVPGVWLRTLARAVAALAPGRWKCFATDAESRSFMAAL